MVKLMELLEDVRTKALTMANEEHDSVFNSNHEAYAVIKEEFEEACDDSLRCDRMLRAIWEDKIKKDEGVTDQMRDMAEMSLHCCAEWLQMSAMCIKAIESEVDKNL